MADDPIGVLSQRLVSQQRQLTESSWNEKALIATLTKLLPGFSQEFDQQHIDAETANSPDDAEELAKTCVCIDEISEGRRSTGRVTFASCIGRSSLVP